MWTRQDLHRLITEKMGDYLLVVVSNRQPYSHIFKKRKIECQRGVGGVVTSLDPIMQACNGIWVASGTGDADHKVVDSQGKIKVPPENPAYTLKRVWLTKEEENGYYYGYSNEALWPLCHTAFQRPIFRKEDWDCYVKVNQKFARAVIEELGDKKALVWIQDYHLCLLPKILKEIAPNQLIVAHFWHIPWPAHETFRVCPQKKEILDGLLANDLMGFHIRYHCQNLLDVIDREIEGRVERERFSFIRAGHETLIRPYPMSVDFEVISELSNSPEVAKAQGSLREEFGLSNLKVLIGLDRFDYIKGLPEKLLAIDRLLEKHPELKEKIVFLQMGPISRLHIPSYKALNDELNTLVEQINWKHSTDGWQPIILARRYLSPIETLALYRIANACIVSSLHDGMNLVAKEFVASRSDETAMLVLSQFTGAARELTDAVLINPYDREETSEAIFNALIMTEEERRKRMAKMREIVRQNNAFRWAGKIISELLKLEFKE
jgi:trehalose 6-phosphate synthase